MYLRFAIFFGILLVIVVSGHVYLYRRLVRDTTRNEKVRLLGAVALSVLGLLPIVGRLLLRLDHNAFTGIAGGVAYGWMGLALFLLLALMVIGSARWVVGRIVRTEMIDALQPEAIDFIQAEPVADDSRRLFLSRAAAGGAVAIASTVSGYGLWRAYHPPDISEVAVRIPKLPKSLDGLTLVQLTDIHLGNLIERPFLEDLVRRANSLKPDLVAITGDLVDGDVPRLGNAAAVLGELKSRFGSFFVTGNHEYYSGVTEWCAFLPTLGVQVLRNRRVSVGDGGGSFDLLGVDDWLGARNPGQGGYDLEAAIADRDPERASVLLAHQPANFDVVAEKGIDLQVSGHTHGGQLFPMTLLVGLAGPYTRGLYTRRTSHLYVSRGCGFWGPPMRVGSPPEILKLVLTT